MMNYEDTLLELRREEMAAYISNEERQRRWEEEHEAEQIAAAPMFDSLEQASIKAYEGWLEDFISHGGKPTHYYDYSFPTRDFRTCFRDLEVYPLYGSSSVSIVLQRRCGLTVHNAGHNNIYYWEGDIPKVLGGWVPVYKDVLPDETAR